MKDAQDLLKRVEALGLKAILEPPEKNACGHMDKQRFFEPFGAPVSVGNHGENNIVIPFVWIAIGIVLILTVIVWLL